MKDSVIEFIKDLFLNHAIEIMLHPSLRRMRMIGIFTITGHAFFWYLWVYCYPQPFEDWRIRILIASSALILILPKNEKSCNSPAMQWYFSFVSWLQLPMFFIWMYDMNAYSSVWMASVAVMIVIYYQLTDWRFATLGLILSSFFIFVLCTFNHGNEASIPTEHFFVFLFSWLSAAILALSSANLRRERLQHALTVIGIMAHELRTPLATMNLIAQAVRQEAQMDPPSPNQLINLSQRIDNLTRTINHHIDLQMANARQTQALSHLTEQAEPISAKALVEKIVRDYPFDSRRESDCLRLIIHDDFQFLGSPRQFTQVLNNLIKNALHSLKAAQSRYNVGDLCIELGQRDNCGRIQILDQGTGVDPEHLPRIFEPFFSTASETGHGLGLAFCKQVVDAAGGKILVCSERDIGASFTIEIPCHTSTPKIPHAI